MPRMAREAFDIIGDVHGCYDELIELLERLGYERRGSTYGAPTGRSLVFLGDLIDRGPKAPEVCELVMDLCDEGAAVCLFGNHEHQLLEHLADRFELGWGLEKTMAQFQGKPELFERLRRFAAELPYQLTLDEGRLVVAHAGCPLEYHGADTPEARHFALYSNPRGYRRLDWAPSYLGAATVVYGHTPIDEARWVNNAICIDTGCCYGGALTALRYPERELVSVAARETYY